MSAVQDRMRITVLGSTGSIGTNTLDVVARHPARFEVFALSASRQVDLLFEQCVRFQPRFAVMVQPEHARALKDRLQAHGLRIQGLRPGPLEQGGGLPEQGVVLEVLGSWADWLAFEQALDRHAPWWTVTQWQMAPGPMPGQVRVRWDARWAWRPHAPVDGAAVSLPVWRPAEPLHAAAPVFEVPGHASVTASAVRSAASEAGRTAGAADPTWRLLGIWHQQGVPYAVLERGQEQFVMSPGQRHERHGHRLLRVGPAEAVLQPPKADAAPLRLVLKGGPQ